MNFQGIADEYFANAKALKRTIEKYEAMLSEKGANCEYLNAKISQFRSLYNEMLNTANDMQARAEKFGNTEQLK